MRGLGRGVSTLCGMGGALWNERAWKGSVHIVPYGRCSVE
jgi:hypothetical protein